MFLVLGLTIIEATLFWLTNIFLYKNLHLLLNKFLWTADPYFVDTAKPIPQPFLIVYLNNTSWTKKDCANLKIFEKSDDIIWYFNYADIVLRPFFLRRANRARPDFVLIRFRKPCLFLRFLLLIRIWTFIICLYCLILAE